MNVGITLFLFLDFLLGYLIIGKTDGILYGAARRLVYKLDELVADRCRYVIFYICKGGVAISGHCNVNVHAILGITGNSSVSCTVDGTIEGVVRWFLGIHHQHVIDIEIKTILQVFVFFLVQIAAYSALMPLCIKNTVIIEG